MSDSIALLLICSQLALKVDSPKCFTLREWNSIAIKLQSESMRPSDLVSMKAEEIQSKVGILDEDAKRIADLCSRMDDLNQAIESYSKVGIHPLTRVDQDYPIRYREHLKASAPIVLFYAGEKALLGQPGIAVVGSRHLDDIGVECAKFVGNACGLSGQVLYSGGAKGVDSLSMDSALEARGTAVGVLAENLVRSVRLQQDALDRGDLCLVTPYLPTAGFSVGAAMGRNRLIYSLADFAIVVSSDIEKGGTWAGATENIRQGWIPVFVLVHDSMPKGNQALLEKGALPFPHPFQEKPTKLPGWLLENSGGFQNKPNQPILF